MTYFLSMFNTGQITLPKKWRSQFNTTKFIATEQNGKLVIEPSLVGVADSVEDKYWALQAQKSEQEGFLTTTESNNFLEKMLNA